MAEDGYGFSRRRRGRGDREQPERERLRTDRIGGVGLVLLAGGTTSLHAPVGGGDTALEDFLADKAAIEPLDAARQD